MLMQLRSLNLTRIYGFGLLKNGVKYDFPFVESLLSFKPLVEKVFYVLGDSSDNTDDIFLKYQDFCLTEKSVWDMTLKDGHVIGVETNKAISFLKKNVDVRNAWGIYLQSDEVLHEEDYELIISDLEKAEKEGCDAMTFKYLHFWKSHHKIAISKTWYPKEIRAIKLDSHVESWGDGQSFKNYKKLFHSDARIYHYGHVREASAYEAKLQFQASFHFKGFRYYRKRLQAKKNSLKQKAILYLGTHPKIMHERIERLGENWTYADVDEVYIIGKKSRFSEKLIERICAKKIIWVSSLKQVPFNKRMRAVITEPTKWDYFLKRTKIHEKMDSLLADNWNADFRLILQLSEKNVGIRSC